MSSESKVIKSVTSGVPELYPAVIIYNTTLDHIRGSHPEEFSRMEDVYQTIEKPNRVHRSKTHPKSLILVNEGCTSTSGDPLRVVVKVLSDMESIMTTAHFTSATDQGPLLWPIQNEE